MSISCSCDWDYDYFWYMPEDFSVMPKRARRRRCASCKKLIDAGTTVLELRRFRLPHCDFEEEFYGEEVPLAPLYLCERCGEIFVNLNAAGFCITLGEGSLEDDLREYWRMTGFDPEKYKVSQQKERKHE